jgi:hypothetical protein
MDSRKYPLEQRFQFFKCWRYAGEIFFSDVRRMSFNIASISFDIPAPGETSALISALPHRE